MGDLGTRSVLGDQFLNSAREDSGKLRCQLFLAWTESGYDSLGFTSQTAYLSFLSLRLIKIGPKNLNYRHNCNNKL